MPRVFDVEKSGSLDNVFRRWIHNPKKILKGYIREGMTILDVGCGPGFFSVEMANMVGKTGKLIAADLQEGMLKKLESKIKGKEIEKRTELHLTQKNRIGVKQNADFILAFYVVHEVPNRMDFFKEIKSILKPDGKIFLAEPKFEVSKKDFEETLNTAKQAGLKIVKREKVFLSRAVILEN